MNLEWDNLMTFDSLALYTILIPLAHPLTTGEAPVISLNRLKYITSIWRPGITKSLPSRKRTIINSMPDEITKAVIMR